jgi:hypothetical protein
MRGLRFGSAIAAVTTALLAVPALASDLDRACTREIFGRITAVSELQATLNAIFDRPVAASIETESGVTGDYGTMEVVMVRVKDGKPVVACVDTKEAAEKFLHAPLSQIGGGKRAEEK